MRILAIDPGPTESAWMMLQDGRPLAFGKEANSELLQGIRDSQFRFRANHLAIEMIASFGMAVGEEVFQTAVWIGRFAEAWDVNVSEWSFVYRKEVKLHLCQSMRAKDANIRQALIDKFGGPDAIGRKKSPGPLYGISGDCWSALAVGVTFLETKLVPAGDTK